MMVIRIPYYTLPDDVNKKRLFLQTSVIGLGFLLLTQYALNYRLLFETFRSSLSPELKLTVFQGLTEGIFMTMSGFDLLIALLVGGNLALLFTAAKRVQKNGKLTLKMSAGLAGSLVSTGCAGCGLSLLSLFGPTVSMGLLPFNGLPFQLLVISFLGVSIRASLKSLQQPILCSR